MNTNFQKILDFFSKNFDRPQNIVETWLIGALDDQDFHPMWLKSSHFSLIFNDPTIKYDWQEEFLDIEKKYDLEK